MEKTKRISYMSQMIITLVVMSIAIENLPILNVIVLLMLPIPIVLFMNKWDVRGTVTLIVVAGLLSALFIGPINAVFLGVYNLLVGMVYALAFKKKQSASKIIFYGTIGIVLYTMLIIIIQGQRIDIDKALIINTYEQLFNDPNIAMAMTQIQIDEMMTMIKQFVDALAVMMPFIMILKAFIRSLLTYHICRFFMKRNQLEVTKIAPFKTIRLPDNFIYGMFFMIIASYIMSLMGMNQGDILLNNIFAVMYFIYGIVGIAVVYYMSCKKNRQVIGIVAIIGFTLFGLWLVLVIMGMIDAIIDLRKIRVKENKIK